VCPACGSLERHRAFWLYARDRFAPGLRVLHFAPEPCLESRLRPKLDYISVDLEPGAADIAAAIEDLPFKDETIDRVICLHVLEHVADDAAALRELRRVLAPGGQALIMVPLLGDTTDEDPEAPPDERVRRFGQADHVRLYGAADLVARIAAAGLRPRVDHLRPTRAQIERHRLVPAGGRLEDPNFTDVYVGVRPAGPEPPPRS
jgi:SAM-dependent methyltransferase